MFFCSAYNPWMKRFEFQTISVFDIQIKGEIILSAHLLHINATQFLQLINIITQDEMRRNELGRLCCSSFF